MKRLFFSIVVIAVCAWEGGGPPPPVWAQAQDMKVPAGCRAAEGAKPGDGGYADRIIHEKTGIELILAPSGSFMMGSRSPAAGGDTHPVHQVTFASPFYVGKIEVTNGQYRKFLQATNYDGKPDTDPAYDLYLRHFRGKSYMSKEDDYPVVWVSWLNAKAFCKWAGLALPSESEWEYASKAGATTEYYFGSERGDFEQYGWATKNSDWHTHPGAQKKPNAWGIYDTLGNVWEWCEDDYSYGTYAAAPSDGSAWVKGRMTRVLRGGSFGIGTGIVGCSCTVRWMSAPGNAFYDVGFRVALKVSRD